MEFLIAAAVTCSDISEKIQRARSHPDLSPAAKAEVIELYKEHFTDAVGLECNWDANAARRNGD